MFWSQKYSRGHHFSIRSTKNLRGRGNPFSTIGINAFHLPCAVPNFTGIPVVIANLHPQYIRSTLYSLARIWYEIAVVVIVVLTIYDNVIGDTLNTFQPFQSHTKSFLEDLRAHLQAKRQSKPSVSAKRCGKCSEIAGFLI